MARYAIVQDGEVINVVEATPEIASANGWIVAPGYVEIGWTFAADDFVAPQFDVTKARASIRPITRRQARLALLGAGKLPQVDAAIAAMPSPRRKAAQIEWQDASVFERNHPLIAIMGAALDLSDDEIDQLFIIAAGL